MPGSSLAYSLAYGAACGGSLACGASLPCGGGVSRQGVSNPPAHAGAGLVALLAGLLLASAPASAEPAGDWQRIWASVLESHTKSVQSTVGTVVDYRALRDGAGAPRWRALVGSLETLPEPKTRDEQLALWINAYNILAIDIVVRSYPVESIRDIGSLFRPVWKHEAGVVAGRRVSLGEIEHEILRPMGEPRIHAAIVCASTSCPSLRRAPFTTSALDAELDEAMRDWLSSPAKGLRVEREARRVTLSRIFDWFDEDFEAAGGVLAVAARYAPEGDRGWLQRNAASADLEFFDYDWSLNRLR